VGLAKEEHVADKKARAAVQSKKKPKPKSNALRRAIRKLKEVYHPILRRYDSAQRAERNRVHKTPTLDYQKTGTRVQDTIDFDPARADPVACPVCGHRRTMPVPGADAAANAANERRRAEAQADGDSAFVGASAVHACFCCKEVCCGEDDGTGCRTCEAAIAADPSVELKRTECKCQCQVKFEEMHRHAIALAVERNKRKQASPRAGEARARGSSADALYSHCMRSDDLYSHCMKNLVNYTVRARQDNDGRSLQPPISPTRYFSAFISTNNYKF